jgi:hypothetical protein
MGPIYWRSKWPHQGRWHNQQIARSAPIYLCDVGLIRQPWADHPKMVFS